MYNIPLTQQQIARTSCFRLHRSIDRSIVSLIAGTDSRFPRTAESQISGRTSPSPSCPTCLGLAFTQWLAASPSVAVFARLDSTHELFMTHTTLFDADTTPPHSQHIFTSLKPLRKSATLSTRHPTGRSQTHADIVLDKKTSFRLPAWIHLSLSDNLHLQRLNSALLQNKAQNTAQFFERCFGLAAIRT